MMKAKPRYATRIYGRDDGLEYTGEIYPTLAQAQRGRRQQIKEMLANKEGGNSGFDWQIHEWRDAYGEIVAGSDI